MVDLLISHGFEAVCLDERLFYVKAGVYCVPQHRLGGTKLYITHANSIDEAVSDINEFEARWDRITP